MSMISGINSEGKMKSIKTNTDGNLEVVIADGSSVGTETTLNASLQTIGTNATSISINKKITSIDIANYSETGTVTLTVGTLQAQIGGNVATTLTINKNIENISLVSTEADTKVQIVVKGVE